MKTRLLNFLFAIATAAIIFSGCTSRKTIEFSEEKNSITPDLTWAVINSAYAPVRSDCDYGAPVISQVRAGEIYLVVGNKTVKHKAAREEDDIDPLRWYKIEKGWVEERNISVYDTKLKAQNAVKKMKEKEKSF